MLVKVKATIHISFSSNVDKGKITGIPFWPKIE